MWWVKRLARQEGTRYAVLVHAKGVLLTDGAGGRVRGGAYAWRYVTAIDRAAAAQAAIESLRSVPAFVNEVDDLDAAIRQTSVEEVSPLHENRRGRGTGVVFYIGDDEEQ